MTARRVVRRSPRPVESSPVAPVRDVTVGLDPSLTGYGIVIWEVDGYSFHLLKTKPEGDTYANRLQEIHDTIVRLLEPVKDRVGIICMERAAYNASGAFTGGLVHAATALALLHVFGPGEPRMAPAMVASTTLKKFVIGNGAAKGKGLMVKHVYKKWGFDTDDDNLADAYGLARLAAAILSPQESEHKYERECIDVVRRSMSWDPLPPQQPPLSTSSLPSQHQGRRAGSTSSARAPRKSSSASATPATSSNSRAASRSRSRTAARSRSEA